MRKRLSLLWSTLTSDSLSSARSLLCLPKRRVSAIDSDDDSGSRHGHKTSSSTHRIIIPLTLNTQGGLACCGLCDRWAKWDTQEREKVSAFRCNRERLWGATLLASGRVVKNRAVKSLLFMPCHGPLGESRTLGVAFILPSTLLLIHTM